MISMIQIFKLAAEKNVSDVHLTAGSSPMLRINGELCKVNVDPLTQEQVKELCYSLLSDEQKSKFENRKSLDFSFLIKGVCRFRGNLFYQKSSVAAVFRVLSNHVPDLDKLGLPPIINNFAKYPHGLVLVTGPTGAGKSTTLAACVEKINQERAAHILTIEDPIEMIYQHKKSIINQKEVGVDCNSFADGLRDSMRADPDVILVGEIRDKATAEVALSLAETGHLVFSTLHTNTAPKTIDRIVGMFDIGTRTLIQNQLSTVLQAVISQRLIFSETKGRVPAVEVMLMNPAIRNLVREGKIHQVYSVMQTNVEQGMSTLSMTLAQLVKNGDITVEDAFNASPEKSELYRLLPQKKKYAA